MNRVGELLNKDTLRVFTTGWEGGVTFVYSAIAGGAIRDSVLARPIKDVDVFVTTKGSVDYTESVYLTMLNIGGCLYLYSLDNEKSSLAPGLISIRMVSKVGEGSLEERGFVSLHGTEEWEGLNLVLMGEEVSAKVRSNKDLVDHLFKDFPCNMSRCAVAGGQYYFDPSFFSGMKRKMFVYDKPVDDYCARMLAKYPSWTVQGKDGELKYNGGVLTFNPLPSHPLPRSGILRGKITPASIVEDLF